MARFSISIAMFAVLLVGIGSALAAEDCRKEVVARGSARPTEGWAKSLALNNWRQAVQKAYGEDFEDLRYAKDATWACAPTTLGTKRCELKATPCQVPREAVTASAGALTGPALARRLQEELVRVGCYGGSIDGDWGSGSRRAVERFSEKSGVELITDKPTQDALLKVERVKKRVCG